MIQEGFNFLIEVKKLLRKLKYYWDILHVVLIKVILCGNDCGNHDLGGCSGILKGRVISYC